MGMRQWLENRLLALGRLRSIFADQATLSGGLTDLNKRQTKFEGVAVYHIQEWLPSYWRLEAEGYKPIGSENAEWIVGFDPTDGTAGDVRSFNAGIRGALPVSAVISMRRGEVKNPTFASVEYAGIIDFRGREIFLAGPGGAFVMGVDGLGEKPLRCIPQYNIHNPAIAWEIARRANALLRFLIPYGIYPETFSDSHSSALVMLWALRGYCDAYLNFNLPGVSGAGQRGHELGALAVFARAMGGVAVQTKVAGDQVMIAGPVDDALYTFDGQTSVILGVDRPIVDHYLTLINNGLARRVTLRNDEMVAMTLSKVITQLYEQYPNERWSLPLLKSEP